MISWTPSLGRSSRFSPPRIAAAPKSSQFGGALYGAPCPLISTVISYLSSMIFEIPRAIISSHQGSVQSLCIPSCYLSKHTMPCTVDAWLKSPEFTELQLLEFYYSPGNHIPHTEHHELVPSAPMSISRFSSSLHTATFVLCDLPDNLVLNL